MWGEVCVSTSSQRGATLLKEMLWILKPWESGIVSLYKEGRTWGTGLARDAKHCREWWGWAVSLFQIMTKFVWGSTNVNLSCPLKGYSNYSSTVGMTANKTINSWRIYMALNDHHLLHSENNVISSQLPYPWSMCESLAVMMYITILSFWGLLFIHFLHCTTQKISNYMLV